MRILIFNNMVISALKYGGTERIMWWLGKALTRMGHQVTFLVKKGSYCNFARVIYFNPKKSIQSQIPENIDLIHAHCTSHEHFVQPVLYTLHGNIIEGQTLPLNTVFVSKNHGERDGSVIYVHNGLDFNDYGTPDLTKNRNYLHFLAKAAWRVKNVKGAIDIANKCQEQFKSNWRISSQPKNGFSFYASSQHSFSRNDGW